MKIKVENLGALRQAEFELGDMTIICGGNNTGKTYATYALFGFLSFWREVFSVTVSDKYVEQLLSEGTTSINIEEYVKIAPKILDQGSDSYTKQLPMVFASAEKNFIDSKFQVSLSPEDIQTNAPFEKQIGAAKADLFSIAKAENQPEVIITLLVEKHKLRITSENIKRTISDAIKDIIFGHLFPNPFIASAERTGAAIFRKELNFARNRVLEQMNLEKNINPLDLLLKVFSDYALPVKTNVDFTRNLEDMAKRESFIFKKYPEILTSFTDIIGGDYTVTRNDELYYVPKGKRIKLTMDESSSAVRSLLDIGFYLRHVAKPGDLLMVDEPELNLHPENQRRVARLFSRLIKVGIKVFITTHSDYIIKELNTLIMLNSGKEHLKAIMDREKYTTEELISSSSVKVYIAEEASVMICGGKRRSKCNTLVQADIDDNFGIEARSFDSTIDDMNRIQEEIIWGVK
ncbi:MAG: ATP-binding protein [Sulfurimonas sp.]|nr:ATP-binding protein [Sulfurimonas sp.]